MLLYSKTITSFIAKIKKKARIIMKEEMGLLFKSTRFIYNGYYYPLNFVVFDDNQKLGYFNSSNYQLAFHKKLMYLASDQLLDNIIRHELAHMFHFISRPGSFAQDKPHGSTFRSICEDFKWSEQVYRAYANIELENKKFATDAEFEKIKSRVQKLMALGQGQNSHESQAATAKANEYLLKYNIQYLDLNSKSDAAELNEMEDTCVKDVIKQKRVNATMNALYDILSHFHVQPVINRTKEAVYLNVVGSRLNVDMADYVTKALINEFERLWQLAQKNNSSLKGQKKKNSYLAGLSAGYCKKLKEQKRPLEKSYSKELIVLDNRLQTRVKMAYPRLSRQGPSTASLCRASFTKGQTDANKLILKKGVTQGNRGKLLENNS